MEIRKAVKDDADSIADFWHKLGRSMKYSEFNELKENAREEALDEFRKMLEKENTEIFIVEEEKKIGFILVNVDERPSRKKGKYASINDIYIEEGYRGKGLGTKMLKRAKQWAVKQKCKYVTVSAEWENERARNFYEKNGFEEKQVKYLKELE